MDPIFRAYPRHSKEVSRSLLVIPNGVYLSKDDSLYIAKNF